MMRAECLVRTSLPDHPWPMRPETMDTDRNNDSGISPGRTSSETNSNSPNFTLNSPHSPDRRPITPTDAPGHARTNKDTHPFLKNPEDNYPFYCVKNSSPYSPQNFGFTLTTPPPHQRHEETPKKASMRECHYTNPGSDFLINLKSDKMDDTSEKSNGCDYERDDMQTEDSLEQLKNALEKSSALSAIFKPRADDSDGGNEGDNGKKEFPCPLCAYTTPYRHRYMEHLSTHYSDKCTLCDFTGQNIQDLRSHLQDVHNISDIHDLSDLQDNNSDYQDDDETPNKRGKSKSFKCKQCNYVTTTKLDFWEHSKGHIKAEKLLTCPKCPFVTEYKHHLEYHLRNHFGSKPFKCNKCSYSCVNKSMLNSHLKSHSNVYQYRCADCAYATKYCHSLKLHLRKYQHKPAMVLNADGSPNPLPIIDVYGTRRGPKLKPNKAAEDSETKGIFLDIKVPDKEKNTPNLPGGIVVPNAPQISPKSPNSFYSLNNNEVKDEPHNGDLSPKFYYCTMCDFHSASLDFLNQHMFLHAAETNFAHIFKTNNNLQDQSLIKDYFQNVLVTMDHVPSSFIESDTVTPLSLMHSKQQVPTVKPPASPLDLSKQESNESEGEIAQETRKSDEGDGQIGRDTLNRLSSTKHRRKGKAYKLEKRMKTESSPEEFFNKSDEETKMERTRNATPPLVQLHKQQTTKDNEEEKTKAALAAVATKDNDVKPKENAKVEDGPDNITKSYSCIYCDIVFKDVVLYTMHMGYHGFQDPFTCNMCGHITPDKVSFFLHIARSSHS